MSNDLIVGQKVYDLILYWHQLIVKFPKNERFVLGQNIEKQLLHVFKLINKINNIHDDRKKYYCELSEEIDALFILNRLTKDLKFISVKQYLTIAERINEIAKISCAWLKK